MPSQQHPNSPMGAAAAAEVISSEMARIHRESYGSGASSVRTYVHDDLVLSVLDVELLPAEAVVIAQGRSDLVLEMRSSFQLELETSFTAAVERATGRKVVAFLSDTHLDPPFVTELFRLGPARELDLPEPVVEAEVDAPANALHDRYAATMDAPAAARHALGVFADRLDQRELEDLQLLVSELVTNAVLYGDAGGGGTIEVDVTLADGTITGEVRDDGDGFEHHRRPPGPSGGWGLFIVERLATTWGIHPDPTRVWFELDRTQ